ncbi:MAG TPA: aldehyde dehydrogenase family protein [Solirubrobacterales bacterium]|jgi:acyl-CoA reductase-like NAD-dependent aldehyde dehydrogenase|nr:aldehyde dehydrogenase family protein [Solirubrobacterales bacterium]
MSQSYDALGTALLPEVAAVREGARRLVIGDELLDAADGATFETIDPGTGETLARVARAGEADVDRAVEAARAALPKWSGAAPAERARLLRRLADLIESKSEELAQLETLDNGKPIDVSRTVDVALAIDHLHYFAGWATKIHGSTVETAFPDQHVYLRREPVGVVGAIIPWNFPLLMATWKLAPALAAGCTAVLKPAEQTPLTALRLGELALEAGLPPGVINVVSGYGDAGAALVAHPGVDKIAFTGSVEVGKSVARGASETLKHVSLELGGKSPNIVFADADLEAATAAAASAIFANTGQVCSAGSRLYVEASAFDEVVAGIGEAARGLRVGHGLDPETTMGPLISQEQLDRVVGYLDRGHSDGGSAVAGGGRPEDRPDGYFVDATVFSGLPETSALVREEIFGPVLVAQPFDDLEQLAAAANGTEFGLAAGVWTKDVSRAHKLAAMLEAGTVWINCFGYFDAAVPFGGYKHSGYGRDGGHEALEKFLQTKAVWANLA